MLFLTPEGATPIHDASGLKQEGINTYAQLCDAEAENILKALRKHLARPKKSPTEWFNEKYLAKVHRDMFQEVWDWAGKYRRSTTNIGVKPFLIPVEIVKLCEDVAFWNSHCNNLPALEQAARIHHRLVLIHPFENGNGRHARLIADMYLHSNGLPYPRWPIDLSKSGNYRTEYIQALKEADRGNYDLLITYTKNHLDTL